MRHSRILVVEDDERILNFLRVKLRAQGYEVLTACDGLDALRKVETEEPDLIVLDIMLPGIDGFEILGRIRSFSHIPVIVLSAKGSDDDKIRGLDLGADDYIGKPFSPDELVARIEAVRRRLEPADRRRKLEPVRCGGLSIDFEKRQVVVDGAERYLTRMEWLLLGELTRNVGRLMTYEELLTRVWGPEYRDDTHILRTWISRLRGKLTGGPERQSLIRTIPKTGYIMELPPY